jgi:phosphoserine aminotransferase
VTERLLNFSPGPGALPLPVLEQAQRDLVSLPGVGASPLEVSHRGPWFGQVLDEAEANLRALLGVPDHHHVLFCQGGATMQFSMVPMNLLRGAEHPAAYVVTGAWGAKAAAEARRAGPVTVPWSGEADGYRRVPSREDLLAAVVDAHAYVHVTTNETIQGVQYPGEPVVPDGTTLVADASSDFLSRPTDVARFDLLYAGAQKNAGPAGVTVVLIRDELLATIPEDLPTLLDYRTFADHRSLFNTPPVFAVYVLMLVTRWLRDDVGGLIEADRRNRHKAALLYTEIDAAPGFYRGHADAAARSLMNVTWRLPSEVLERRFVEEAEGHGMIGLRGHRSVGGIRASLYNAVPTEHVETLAAFVRDFRDRNAG